MKKGLYILWLVLVVFTSCKNDDESVFEKTADERVEEAVASLKQDLVAPPNGWRLKYRPEEESGSFYVLLDFDENNVTIKSDLGINDGEFFEETVTYRIDNSLGVELIIESYSFFSFLFEQDQATFGAEFEFNFVNKTPDNALVFRSKTDLGSPTILLFEEAGPMDINLLGTTLSANLNTMAEDFEKISSSLTLTYENKDLAFYVVLDNLKRTLTINSASRKTNTSITQEINFTSPYILKGDSLVLDTGFTRSVLSNNISIKGIKFTDFGEGTLNICTNPSPVHNYEGVTSANDKVILETGLLDISGKTFSTLSDFYFSPLYYILDNGKSASAEISQNVAGAVEMHLYYNYDIGGNEPLYGIGFVIVNLDGSTTFALRQFSPVLADNKITFNFEPEITIFGSQNTDANIENVNIYLEALTEGDNTFVFKLNDNVYEFHNPCTGWSVVFINANQ